MATAMKIEKSSEQSLHGAFGLIAGAAVAAVMALVFKGTFFVFDVNFLMLAIAALPLGSYFGMRDFENEDGERMRSALWLTAMALPLFITTFALTGGSPAMIGFAGLAAVAIAALIHSRSIGLETPKVDWTSRFASAHQSLEYSQVDLERRRRSQGALLADFDKRLQRSVREGQLEEHEEVVFVEATCTQGATA